MLRVRQERDAGPPQQEVVSLRRPGQAIVQAVAEDTGRLVTRFGTDIDHHDRHFLAPRALEGAAIMIDYVRFN